MNENFKNEIVIAMMERIIKRLWILCIILIILLAGTNAAWIYYENQWEDTITTTVEQDTDDGSNTYIGRDNYGETKSDDN